MVTVAEPNRGIVRSGSASKSQMASFTTTWLNVTGCGPPFRTLNTNSYGVGRATRCTLRSSTGGASWRPTPAPLNTMKASSIPSPRSGRRPSSTQPGPRPSPSIAPLLLHVEEAHPAELGELADVGVEHEPAGEAVAELHDPALSLPKHLRIREIRGFQLRARRVVVEEVGVRVEAVYEVELEHVYHIDPDELTLAYLYGVLPVEEGHSVHGVDLVGGVEVGVEAVHDHDQLVGFFAPLFGIHDERPVEPLLDVLPQGRDVAVVEVHPERLGVELVDELLSGPHELEDTVHVRRVEPVEVDRVRVRILVLEHHTHPIPLGSPQRRPRHLPVVGPRRVHHPRRDLDLHRLGHELVLPDDPASFPPLFPPIEASQELDRIEPRGVHVAHRAVPAMRTHVLVGRRLRDFFSVVTFILPAGTARVSPQERAGDPQGPRSPQEIPTRDAPVLGLAHPCSSHPVRELPITLALSNLFY